MARLRQNDYQRDLETLIRAAVATLRCLPNLGLAPAQYSSCMPQIVRSLRDMDYAPEKTNITRFGASRAAIDNLDKMLVAIAGAQITAMQREIVWQRGERKSFKVIAILQGVSPRTARRHHTKGLAEVASYLLAKQGKPTALFKNGPKRRAAV